MKLEDELRRALKREAPPDDFVDRVIARIESTPLRPVSTARRRLVGIAVAAAIAAASASSLYYVHRRQVLEAERVRKEAIVGLRVASAKLNQVHDMLLQRISNQNERSR
jgi:hypothetical protein